HAALGGDEAIRLYDGVLFFGKVQRAHGLAFVHCGNDFFQHGHQLDAVLVAGTRQLQVALQGLVGGGHVGQGEFGIDDLDVRYRVHLAGDVHDVFIFETAHHVHDGVGFADVGQELV